MNKSGNLYKFLLNSVVMTLTFIGAVSAQAEQLSPALYADQLDRCAAEVRADMATPDTARLQHELTAVDRTGLWYQIEIRTTALNAADVITDQATILCKAHRWTDETVVDIQRSEPAVAGARLAAND